MVQHMHLTPLFTKVRFGLWREVLAEPAPPADLRYMLAMWHAARGLARAAEGRLDEAEKDRAAVAALKDDETLKTLGVSSVNVAATVVAIAHEVLSGELAVKRRRAEEAARHFAAAVTLEDNLTYMEPPDWPIPVRQLQGAALLEVGRAREAEAAFRGDLRKFPSNGWSLSGLRASLERQGRSGEVTAVEAEFRQSWRRADTELAAARIKN